MMFLQFSVLLATFTFVFAGYGGHPYQQVVATYMPAPSYVQPTYSNPMAYAQPAYAAPSHDVHDVTKIVDYDYAVNDYYGNVQNRREHVEPGKQIGYWSALMADGAVHTVDYEAGPYGNLAHVIVRKNSYDTPYSAPYAAYSAPAPAYSAPAPAYSAPAPAYSAPAPAYSAPSPVYSAPSYDNDYSGEYNNDYSIDYNDVKKIVDYDYAVNDYYGNEQSKREHVEDDYINGEYRTRLPDGVLQVVTYNSGPNGHLAEVQNL